MLITLLQLASAVAPFPTGGAARPWWFYLVIAGSGVLLLGGIGILLWWLLSYRRQRSEAAGAQQPRSRGIEKKRLTAIWDRFIENLPGPVRASLPEHAHFLVMGMAGVGKSTLIDRKIDWQGQASQFLPSYTADPLLQIYLGSKTVVQEMAGPLLESTSRATNEAMLRLFRGIAMDQPPTVLLALKVSWLTTATPDQLRQQAQLMRGKINLLAESFGVPIPTRICLTHMERTRGYGDVARFLKRNKVALELPVGADAGLVASLQSYEKYLPRALTTLPVAAFQSNVGFLLSAEDVVGPVRNFIQALLEGSLSAARPELQKLYFFSPDPDEQVGNPFDAQVARPELAPKLSWLRRWLRQLGIEPLHAAIGGLLLLAGLIGLGVVTRRHAALVRQAEAATAAFEGTVRRAQEARTVPSESEAVRASEREASAALAAVHAAEGRLRPLRLLFRSDKAAAQQRFVDGVRDGYLVPELERSVRQRSRERILYSLVAVYATRHNTLGGLITSHPAEWSTVIAVPADVLTDFVRASEQPWRGLALRLLPALPSEGSRWPVNDLKPWREFAAAIVAALPLPYITTLQLQGFQKDADKLLETLAQVRKAAVLRQIFQALREETPLDMLHLFGRDAGALAPHRFIVDHQDTLERLLLLVRDSSLQFGGGGRMSLYRLLKWINELNNDRPRPLLGADGKQPEEEIYHLPFPDARPTEISRRAWLELLLRSRKHLLLVQRVSSATPGRHHSHRCPVPVKKKRRPPATCPLDRADDARDGEDATGDRRPRPRDGERGSLPLWSREELVPKLTALMNSDATPDSDIGELYNRVLFEREVLPLIQELKKALATSKRLSPEEKLRLSQLVKEEVAGYARRYCAALQRYYLSYHFRASSASLHSELLNLTSPGSPFVAHLRTVADNVLLDGLSEPYLHSLAQCLAGLQPVAALVYPEAAKRDLDKDNKDNKDNKDGKDNKEPGKDGAKDRPRPTGGLPEGLQPYKEAITKLVGELDGQPAAGGTAERDKEPLAERLGPFGKVALAAAQGRGDSPLRLAEKFLDNAGVAGELRRPFLSPFQVAYREGVAEIERELSSHWRDELLPQVSPLFSRFPFDRAAEREVAPAELDVLNEGKGIFFQDLRTFYAPVIVERSGSYRQKPASPGAVPFNLPEDLLPTVNRLAQLSRALFRADGSRQPLRLSIRGLPGRSVQEERTTQPTIAFLQVGKAAAYGFNQQPAAVPLIVDWWDQGVAVVGVESTTSSTGRRQTQSIEVADSAWSLFRLLQKSTLERDGTSTWRLLGDGPVESQALRFVIQPDPWGLFSVRLP